ncbi:poly-gamma-glutamate biosynthesis protein PgsC/CapC [Qipengyuania sp. CAU 1752]
MDLFPLTLFPDGALASSVITTVWVGVFVLCFFNLRFGWVLSGLVVPGYLVPLVIVKPVAALVIVIEAILTYLIVWTFSERISRGRFPALFGRDRFMGLILASIAVRLSMDGVILPEFADWMQENFDRRFDWRDNLQSFGLVIISLLANQFWKPGLGRGLAAAVVTIGLTYLIVRFGLMEFTNFRMSGVSYLYEGLASSILASPKAYIILTLTAMIASQVNVRYGWDFSGILIPALIALQWYQPTKVLTSFAEAIVIYLIARAILKMPMMANATIEGGRKLLLFFNISFAWKMLVGWAVVWMGLDVKTTDFYGFGYLLSTLIAIKAHDKNIFPRLARSTLQVSLLGAVFGNLFGFALSAAVTKVSSADDTAKGAAASPSRTPQLDNLLVQAVGDAHVRRMRGKAHPLSPQSAETLAGLIEMFEAGIPATSPAFDLTADDWRVQRVEGGHFAIIRADGAGAETLIFDPSASRELAVVLPDPTALPGLGLAGRELQRAQDARWLVIAAPAPSTALVETGVVDVFRSTSNDARLRVEGDRGAVGSQAIFADRSASAADISALRETLPGLAVTLRAYATQRIGDVARIVLDQAAVDSLARAVFEGEDHQQARLVRCTMPRAGNLSRGWSDLGQLAYLRFEIARPMLASVREGSRPALAVAAARLGGFELDRCRLAGRNQWRLHAPLRDDGIAFFAEGQKPEKVVLSYRPPDGALAARIGAATYSEWEGDALIVAPRSDTLFRSSRSSFDVLWQIVVRAQERSEQVSILQLREAPSSVWPRQLAQDVVIARDRVGAPDEEFEALLSAMRSAGLRAELADADPRWAGFERRPGTALRYLTQTSGRRYAIGWVITPEQAP